MSKRNIELLIEDMLNACNRIIRYTQNPDFSSFIEDNKTVDATVRNIQILEEAASQIPEDFQNGNTQIELTKIIRSKHILVHEYFEFDYAHYMADYY